MLSVSKWQIVKMLEIFAGHDLGAKLKILQLKREISKGRGANNKGVYLADALSNMGTLTNVVVKIAKSSNWWFYRSNAISQLCLGTQYLGWAEIGLDSAIVMTFVSGVEEKDKQFTLYFCQRTIKELYQIYSLFIETGIVFSSLDYLISKGGGVHLIDYDSLTYVPIWTPSNREEVLAAIKREKEFLQDTLPKTKWQESVVYFEQLRRKAEGKLN